MPYLIYKISNTVNDKLYVGCTTGPIEERWKTHVLVARGQRILETCSALYTAMREYSIDQFSIESIEECSDIETMRARERYWIRQLSSKAPNGYNLSVRLLTDEQVAIIRFNVYGLTTKAYADLFGVSTGTIQIAKTGKGSFFRSDPYYYITREHVPIQSRECGPGEVY